MAGKNHGVDDPSLLESVVKENPSRKKTWSQAHLSTSKVGAMGTDSQVFDYRFPIVFQIPKLALVPSL